MPVIAYVRRALTLAAISCGFFAAATPAASAQPHHHEGAVAMPEPMVFDLVRPLGAKRGELEINALLQQSTAVGAPLAWAPEIEWAFRDGLAIEGELPFENGRLKTWKVALQGTLSGSAGGRFQHGWQVIGQRVRADRSWVADALYLAGFRPSPRVTLFSMTGARRSVIDQELSVQPVQNTTLFFQPSAGLILGVETNLVLGAADRRSRLVMPQLQVALFGRYLAEFGIGAEERAPGRWGSAMAARFVRQLH